MERASTVASAPGPVNVENMMTGSEGQVLRISTRVDKPSITGISMSNRTRSGFSRSICRSPISPLAAVPTTSRSGSSFSIAAMKPRTTAESSTTSTPTFALIASPPNRRP